MHQIEDIIDLLKKDFKGTLTDKESKALKEWANLTPENQRLLDRVAQRQLIKDDLRLYQALWTEQEANQRNQRIVANTFRQIKAESATPRPHKTLLKNMERAYLVAAVVLVAFIVVLSLNLTKQVKHTPGSDITINDIMPGGNQATLILGDGSTIDLKSDQSGIIIGADITYIDGAAVASFQNNAKAASETVVVKTPMGGNYRIILPDGTQVWLNASSALTYQSKFSNGERTVHLEGEAYFKVEPLQTGVLPVPFKVKSKGQEINVHGTEFNVQAYKEETQTETTLISGSIDIVNLITNLSTKMMPGQQAILKGNTINVDDVDVLKAIAWKNGRFSFDNKPFDKIMAEMARWYNFEVEYPDGIPTDRFLGDAYKTDKLSSVLRFLESSDILYQIKSNETGKPLLLIQQAKERRRIITNQ